MRAVCETCDRPQPAEWSGGDLCVHCGAAVRRELRCFWCVKWTPADGAFCRTCGAAVIDHTLFGAARMLKDAGVDRFALPRKLRELDPEQIDNFARIYYRHWVALQRFLDDVRFLERYLQGKHWSATLEEQLIVELPWPEERLAKFEIKPTPSNALERARYIDAHSPVFLVRALAILVRVLLEDWEIQREAMGVLAWQDPHLRAEAVLALSHWRVVYGPGIRDYRAELTYELENCALPFQAAVHLAMMSGKPELLPAESHTSHDPDIAFCVALVTGDIDKLAAAQQQGDTLKAYAATFRLLRMGHFQGASDVMCRASDAQRSTLMSLMACYKGPAGVGAP